ncbi:hypothetical protein SELR_00960 [Selenomonas ruminantium subsp. lactilytica TAM6421]|uniref:TPR repeat n=1 Tax=Selenomonas ruminantium subsp. lactilytica (strain NBRC 103574 / TAM6421) TaxID=927704 RepID=I0GM17_SELRL|nr:tetratricopeptide repeat protein [Selenomonas ruminantium]BAL81804.1 hypothetical protein SELR_00960 [Selenomonas ruminantium subsp. lactilytica TAM6421]
MGKQFTPAVHEAVELIWCHADAESARRGQAMLQQAAEAGDADAWGLLARTYMGQEAVWENSGLPQIKDGEKVHAYILKSIAGGSAAGVVCAVAQRWFYPTEQEALLAHWESSEAAWEDAKAYTGKEGEPMMSFLVGAAYRYGAEPLLRGQSTHEAPLVRARKALPYLEEAVEGGFAWALDLYKDCVGIISQAERDGALIAKYRKLEDKFCREGVPHAIWSRGEDLYEQQNYEAARSYYEKAAAGLDNARFNLGYMLRHGQGISENPRQALEEYFLPLAEQGHVNSMYQVADIYFWGDFFPRDFAKAYAWCERALGRVTECHGFYAYDVLLPLMCYCKLYGQGTPADEKLAALTIQEEMQREEAAPSLPGYKRALLQYLMAEVYAHGYGGISQDEELAETYRQAATEYGGFKSMLAKMSWARNPIVLYSQTKDEDGPLNGETLRSWQERRTAQADQQRTWRLGFDLPCGRSIGFVHYGEEELRAALDLLKQDCYGILLLDKEHSDSEHLAVGYGLGGYYLQAYLGGRYFCKEVAQQAEALDCLSAWAANEGLQGQDWQADEDAEKKSQWNYYLRLAEKCKQQGDKPGRIVALERAAELGCGHAMNLLGIIHSDDIKEASIWFLNAARTDDADDVVSAWYSLGKLHKENAQGDGAQALHYLEKAAKMGDSAAWLELGICYLKGIGTKKDYEKGVACYEQSIAMGDYEAMLARAHLCVDAEGEWHDLEAAIPCLERVAYEECADNDWQNEGRVMLAKAYLAKDTDAYYEKARSLVRQAAGEGNMEGAFALAHFYKEDGEMIAYRKVLKRAAEDGYEPAQEEVEHMYDTSEWSECL